MRCSIGIGIGETAIESADDLLRNADVAMYVAKARDNGSYELFDPHMQDPDLLPQITSALSAAGLPPASLVLELTENLLLRDSAALRARLDALRAAGVRLAIDDFGTGYSSLGYLRQFPFDILKIDKSFADGLGTEPSGSALLAAVTRMGDTLGLTTLVEGVERPDQVAELIALGCRYAQGYHFSHPLPSAEMERWLATHASQVPTAR